MLSYFFLFITHVFNSENSGVRHNIRYCIQYCHGIQNEVLVPNRSVDDFYIYSKDDYAWDIKDSSINSYVIYVFLFPKGSDMNSNLNNLLFGNFNSLKKYLLAIAHEGFRHVWITEKINLSSELDHSFGMIRDFKNDRSYMDAEFYSNNPENLKCLNGDVMLYASKKDFDLEKIKPGDLVKSCIFIGTENPIVQPAFEITSILKNIKSNYVLILIIISIGAILLLILYHLRSGKKEIEQKEEEI